MCDPLTIAGIALTAGSALVNNMAARKAQKARDDALAAERIRQNKLDQEANALNAQSQDRYEDFEGQQEDKSSELGDFFTDQQTAASDAANAATAEMSVPQTSSSIVVREEGKQRGKARAFTDAQGEALGELRSFGDLLGGISRLQARDAAQIGTIGGFKRGSAAVNPLELDAASRAGDGLKLFGDILNLGGGLATSAGLGGGTLFGGAAPAAVTTSAVDPWAGIRATTARTAAPLGLAGLYGGR